MGLRSRRAFWFGKGTLVLGIVCAWGGAWGFGQEAAPSASPEAAAGLANEIAADPVAERLRKLEATNERLIQQFESVTKQNEELSKKVQDLSDRLETGPSTDLDLEEGGPTAAASGTRGAGGGVANVNPEREFRRGAGTRGWWQPEFVGERNPGRGRWRGGTQPLGGQRGAGQGSHEGLFMIGTASDTHFSRRTMSSSCVSTPCFRVDSRDYLTKNQNPVLNDFDIPRMRLLFSGRLTRPIEYQLALQRSLGSLDVLNAYLNFHYDDRIQFRAGTVQGTVYL